MSQNFSGASTVTDVLLRPIALRVMRIRRHVRPVTSPARTTPELIPPIAESRVRRHHCPLEYASTNRAARRAYRGGPARLRCMNGIVLSTFARLCRAAMPWLVAVCPPKRSARMAITGQLPSQRCVETRTAHPLHRPITKRCAKSRKTGGGLQKFERI
jgi:hypothetical protein